MLAPVGQHCQCWPHQLVILRDLDQVIGLRLAGLPVVRTEPRTSRCRRIGHPGVGTSDIQVSEKRWLLRRAHEWLQEIEGAELEKSRQAGPGNDDDRLEGRLPPRPRPPHPAVVEALRGATDALAPAVGGLPSDLPTPTRMP